MRTERIEPGRGQESVWDYPRPPRIERTSKRVRVVFNEVVIAESTRSLRVLETSHPPVYYIPKEDVAMEYLRPSERVSGCEWKGIANYFTIRIGDREALDSAWVYRDPKAEFMAIRDHIAFYPSKMDACFVEGRDGASSTRRLLWRMDNKTDCRPIQRGTGYLWMVK